MRRPAEHEEAVVRAGHRAHRVLEEAEPVGHVVARGHDHARGPCRCGRRGTSWPSGRRCPRPAPAAAGAPARRTCCRPRRAAPHPALRRGARGAARHGRDVGHLEQRVRRRLEPDQPGPFGQGRARARRRRRRPGPRSGPRCRAAARPARRTGRCRRRRRRRRRSPRRAPRARRGSPWPPIRTRTRSRRPRPRGPRPRAPAAPGSGSGSARTRSRRAAGQPRPARRWTSGRSAG